jgi:hypothetical protein
MEHGYSLPRLQTSYISWGEDCTEETEASNPSKATRFTRRGKNLQQTDCGLFS